MKKLSKFTVFFILLLTGIAALVLVGLITSNLVSALSTINPIEEEMYLGFVLECFCYLLGVLAGGFSLSTILYQCIRIADNTEIKYGSQDKN